MSFKFIGMSLRIITTYQLDYCENVQRCTKEENSDDAPIKLVSLQR